MEARDKQEEEKHKSNSNDQYNHTDNKLLMNKKNIGRAMKTAVNTSKNRLSDENDTHITPEAYIAYCRGFLKVIEEKTYDFIMQGPTKRKQSHRRSRSRDIKNRLKDCLIFDVELVDSKNLKVDANKVISLVAKKIGEHSTENYNDYSIDNRENSEINIRSRKIKRKLAEILSDRISSYNYYNVLRILESNLEAVFITKMRNRRNKKPKDAEFMEIKTIADKVTAFKKSYPHLSSEGLKYVQYNDVLTDIFGIESLEIDECKES